MDFCLKRYLHALTAFCLLCLGATTSASAAVIDVVASFTVLGDVVKNVGGDHVRVRSLVPPDGDPHEFEPSPDDVKALKAASVVFVSGKGLETWFERLAKAAGGTKPVVVSDGIKEHTMREDGKTIIDPHVWNSVPNVMTWVDNIERALEKADPKDVSDFKHTAERYRATLRDLDQYVRARIGDIPASKRKILTSHDAFSYMGREYGLKFLAPQSVSTEMEASAADVATLIDQIKSEGLTAYFVENSTDTALVKQVANATHAQPGGMLYPEALSPAGGPIRSYVGMIRYNTDQMAMATLSRAK